MNATVAVVGVRTEGVDRIGMIISSICALHCMAGSLATASASALSVLANEHAELALVSVALTIAALSIGLGVRRHRTLWPLGCLTAGIAALVAARTVEEGEALLSIAGSALLVLAHGTNLRALRRWRRCC